MTIREIRFDGYSPVAVLDDGTFDTFAAHRFDAVVSDARKGVIDLDNVFHIELEELDDDFADVDDVALALTDDDFDLQIDPSGWITTVLRRLLTREKRSAAPVLNCDAAALW